MDNLLRLSNEFLTIKKETYKRYFYYENNLENRLSIILGNRGVGKTIFVTQYIRDNYGMNPEKAVYIPADHFIMESKSLYEVSEAFYKLGGELICFDEIHKYNGWSKEIKSIYDTFPNLKIIATGSSALELSTGIVDLSRRAIVYYMNGMSFRENIELSYNLKLDKLTLTDILANHIVISNDIIEYLGKNGLKILKLFKDYLSHGYYPYYREFNDIKLFYITLEQNIKTTLENDLISVHPTITGNTLKKIKKLLSIIASSVPFVPDLKTLKNQIDVGDERTLKTYLKYLEDAGIIVSISKAGKGMRELEKPEKIYLNNTNLAYGLYFGDDVNVGTIRETFFINTLSLKHRVKTVERGDFIVDDKYVFEIGGQNKSFNQIKDMPFSYLAVDNIEIGYGNKIPLWLFGFLY